MKHKFFTLLTAILLLTTYIPVYGVSTKEHFEYISVLNETHENINNNTNTTLNSVNPEEQKNSSIKEELVEQIEDEEVSINDPLMPSDISEPEIILNENIQKEIDNNQSESEEQKNSSIKEELVEQIENEEVSITDPTIASDIIEPEIILNEAIQKEIDNSQSKSEDIIHTWEELNIWLSSHFGSGDTITFGNTIIIPESAGAINFFNIVINTDKYGLVIASDSVVFNFTKIIGEGIEMPVITITENGSAYMSGNSHLTATGTNGVGGSAIYLENGGNIEVNYGSWLEIYALGINSVAIHTQDAFYLERTAIHSDGIGIFAESNVSLFLCNIDADIPIMTTKTVVLDTCITNKQISNANIIKRQITNIELQQHEKHYLMSLGKPVPNGWLEATTAIVFIDEQELHIPVRWDKSLIDTNVAGEYLATASILSPYDYFDLDKTYPLQITAKVVDAQIPHFISIMSFFSFKRNELIANISLLWDTNNPRNAKVMLSYDEGKSWRDISDTQDWIDYYEGGGYLDLWIPHTELSKPICIKIIVEGIGESNIIQLTLDANDDIILDEVGGDRSGIDRGENTFPVEEKQTITLPNEKQTITLPNEKQTITLPNEKQIITLPNEKQIITLPNEKQIITLPNEKQIITLPNEKQIITLPNEKQIITLPNEKQIPLSDVEAFDDENTTLFSTNSSNLSPIDITPVTESVFALTDNKPTDLLVESSTDKILDLQKQTDKTSLIITGQKLLAMITANPNYVTFIHNDMWVSIPTSYLQKLNLSDTDIFSIYLTKPDGNSFSVAFSLNDNELETPFEEPFLVSIPWNNGSVSCVSNSGLTSNATLSDNKAIFPLIHIGTYDLVLMKYIIPVSGTIEGELPNPNHAKIKSPNIYTEKSNIPYKDNFLSVVLVSGFGLSVVVLYFIFSHKKQVATNSTNKIHNHPKVH